MYKMWVLHQWPCILNYVNSRILRHILVFLLYYFILLYCVDMVFYHLAQIDTVALLQTLLVCFILCVNTVQSLSFCTIRQAVCWDSDLQLKIDTLKWLCVILVKILMDHITHALSLQDIWFGNIISMKNTAFLSMLQEINMKYMFVGECMY